MMLLSMRILILLVAEMMNYSQSFSYQKVRSFSVNKRDNVICKIVKIQSQQKPEDNEQKKYLKNTVTSIWNFIYPWQGLSDKIDNLASLITNSSNGVDGKFDRIDGKFDRIDGRFDRIDSKFDRIEDSLEELMADYDFARKLTMRNQLTTTYSSRYARRTNVANLNSLVDLFGTKPFQMFEGDSTDPLEVVSKRRHRVASNFLVSA